ncbi:uncharacterized protein LOC115230029 [Octopus sinensis]|uniref:Uncharacterized protein LOC115230029 n=1 Tax=Octopus sinensis TaxID=2607531 RepID=A0A6P7U1K0_9MOLL|nr:uncharacterized protein LOC115230029 [Octopus sinensis]
MSVFLDKKKMNPMGPPAEVNYKKDMVDAGTMSLGLDNATRAYINNNPTFGSRVANTNFHTLSAIIEDVDCVSKNEWVSQAVHATRQRLGRIPRGGWSFILEKFNVKFSESTSLTRLKNMANLKPVVGNNNEAGGSNSKQFPTREQVEISNFRNCLEEINFQIKEVKSIPREARKPTWKIPRKYVKADILMGLNSAIYHITKDDPPRDINAICDILYAAQCAYSVLTKKVKPQTTWLGNTEAKISKLSAELELVNCYVRQALPQCEKQNVMDILCRYGYKKKKKGELSRIESLLHDLIRVKKKQIAVYNSRKDFRKDNVCFELNRRRFYRNLSKSNEVTTYSFDDEECMSFWEKVWSKRREISVSLDNVSKRITGSEDMLPDLTNNYIMEIIKYLPDWKAPGCDGIYNFFIKRLESLHEFLCVEIKKIINGDYMPENWFYTGITYLIPKKNDCETPKDLRPITCMSTLYKLVTKCVNGKLSEFMDVFGLISDNQLGTRRQCQGAKEQALINQCLNKEYGNGLYSAWIDVKKAFDSVDHDFLFHVLECSGIPVWIVNFVKRTVRMWTVKLHVDGRRIGSVKLSRGILQGDSLSPQLFVMVMDPLSRILNAMFPKVQINQQDPNMLTYSTNHLFFIDDLKIFALKEDVVIKMMEAVDGFFKTVGLEMNSEKSASNVKSLSCCETLEGVKGYRYLGVLEDAGSNVLKSKVMDSILGNVKERITMLSKTKLNAVNLFHAINEHAISLYNYYIGLINIEPHEFDCIDRQIRQLLTTLRLHLKPANKERLYLNRKSLGRGLASVSFRSELILFQFMKSLERQSTVCLRRSGILRVIQINKWHMATIAGFLASKYAILDMENLGVEFIKDAQRKYLLKNINCKMLHSVLFKCMDEQNVDLATSSEWLSKGNNGPRSEALYCLLQDRNLFFTSMGSLCSHCKKCKKTVDHLATQCGKMLNSDYLRRHNEVVKCIHLHLCRTYGIKRGSKLKTHSVQSILSTQNVEIRVDMSIMTETKVQSNKPDIFVYDKTKQEITLIEVGITSQDRLKQVEIEKFRKYDLLANELSILYDAKVKIIPVVLTWDGVVSRYFKNYMDKLSIEKATRIYIQSVVLKRTLENMVVERRHGVRVSAEEYTSAVYQLAEVACCRDTPVKAMRQIENLSDWEIESEEEPAPQFDCHPSIPFNGLRSYFSILDKSIKPIYDITVEISTEKYNSKAQTNNLRQHVDILEQMLKLADVMDLLVSPNTSSSNPRQMEQVIEKINQVDQTVFFRSKMAFFVILIDNFRVSKCLPQTFKSLGFIFCGLSSQKYGDERFNIYLQIYTTQLLTHIKIIYSIEINDGIQVGLCRFL